MRVSGIRRRGADERGATVAIVVFVLVVMLGMLSLAVDVGAMMWRRRAMVNANDAAALAAALSCARAEGQATAEGQSDTLASSNVPGSVRNSIVFDPACDAPAGKVTVFYQSQQELFFAPVVGFDSEVTVGAQATAMWGAAGGAVNVAPLMLSQGRLATGCDIPDNVQIGDTCAFWWNNSPTAKQVDLANAEWALMNLDLWGAEDGITRYSGGCSNSGFSNYDNWIDNGYPDALMLDDPGPTYVCRDSGNFGGALNNTIFDAIERGDPLYFPVNDPLQQVDRYGNFCPPGSTGCTPDKYAIIGFARLELVALYKGNTANARTWCADQWVKDSNARCLVAQWVGYETGGLEPGDGPNLGLIAIRLSE